MNPYSSLTEQQRVAAIELFESGLAHKATAAKLGVGHQAVRVLFERWKIRGRGALQAKGTVSKFSFDTKLEIVLRFVAGDVTATDLCREYGVSSREVLKRWVRIYRLEGEDGLRPKPRGRRPRPPSPLEPVSELEQLRAENERLRAEVAYLGKLRALRAQERQ